jgi:hypothetical protein
MIACLLTGLATPLMAADRVEVVVEGVDEWRLVTERLTAAGGER